MVKKVNSSRGVSSNLSTERALSIIELLAKSPEPMMLQTIAKALETTPSTVLRFMTTLQNRGYIQQNVETKRYFLTYKICSIANDVMSKTNLSDIARPYLKKVSMLFGESSSISIENNMAVVYVGVEEGPEQMIKSMQFIGKVAPLYCTGSGKLFLSQYSTDRYHQFLKHKELIKLTENTLSDKEALANDLSVIRKNGYSIDNEECEIGARCISYPVRDYTGQIVAAINVTGPTTRMTPNYIASKKDQLRQIAEEISERLGYRS